MPYGFDDLQEMPDGQMGPGAPRGALYPAQQAPMPTGGLYPRSAPPALMRPNGYGLKDALKDVFSPAAAGSLAGPGGTVAGLIYGIETAAGKYKLSRDPLAQMEYAARYAQAQYEQQNPGIKYDTMLANANSEPSAVATFKYWESLTPEKQKQFIDVQRSPGAAYGAPVQDANGNWISPPKMAGVDPRVIGKGPDSPEGFAARARGEGQIEASKSGQGTAAEIAARTSPSAIAAQSELEASKTEAVDTTKTNEAMYSTLYTATNDMQNSLGILRQIRDKVAKGPETGALAEWQALIDPDLQALQAQVRRNTLSSLTAAKQAGATFGSMSEGEWNVVGSLGTQLKNTKEANLDILDDQIAAVQQQIGETSARLRKVPKRGRPTPPETPARQAPQGKRIGNVTVRPAP